MGQTDQARALLQECLQLAQARPRARTTLLALKYLALTDLEDERPEAALTGLQTLMQRASAGDVPDLQVDAGLGLGQREAARAAAEAALALVRRQGDPEPEIEILATLGRIAAPAPEALDYLQQALRLAEGLAGYAPSADLLDEAAALAAELQQWPQAYGWAQRASALRQQRFGEETSRRAAALQVRHQIERARAESEHLRRLAEAEAERAAALQQAHDTLLHLSAVGQEITAQLESQRVFESLSRHVQAMLDARSLAIYVLGDSGEQLLCAYGVEDGQRFEDPPLPMDEASSYCVRCVRERREIVLQGAEMVDPQAQVPGTSQMASLMFAPLALSDRVLGVMTIQSPQPQAYGERERLVLRSLCAYGAIALDNARAYQRLGALQRHMLAQEKLAALGAMVAGVAHELNTPIGNSLLVASTLLSSAREFEAQLSAGTLRRSQWETYAQRQREGLAVVERCMDSAAALVRSFKQVAVDRSAESRRRFDLAELAQQCAQTLGLALRRAGIEVELMLPPGLMMDSYPGTLSQVLVILLNNALVHAFSVRVEGARVQLGAQALDAQHLRLRVQDNGLGMASQVLERVFEPFFTTRFGQGGSGLGLSIAHNLVESLLGGRISASSEPGRGSRFVLELPLRAPD
jgi:signal transduction histidine kinase